jgi:hypothetical protein
MAGARNPRIAISGLKALPAALLLLLVVVVVVPRCTGALGKVLPTVSAPNGNASSQEAHDGLQVKMDCKSRWIAAVSSVLDQP